MFVSPAFYSGYVTTDLRQLGWYTFAADGPLATLHNRLKNNVFTYPAAVFVSPAFYSGYVTTDLQQLGWHTFAADGPLATLHNRLLKNKTNNTVN